jgi:hypothetical protein
MERETFQPVITEHFHPAGTRLSILLTARLSIMLRSDLSLTATIARDLHPAITRPFNNVRNRVSAVA